MLSGNGIGRRFSRFLTAMRRLVKLFTLVWL